MSVRAGVGSAQVLGAGLWATVAYESRGNLALSPFSVAVALGMALAGAEGQTRSEIEDVLGGGTGLGDVARLLGGDGDDDVVIDAANAIFAQAGLAWQQDFLDTLVDEFDAEPRMVDYAETEAARSEINGWTADRTRDRIPQIVPAGVLTPESRLVLVNALYFKAPWAEQFGEHSTADADFHLADGSTVQVPTMRLVLHAATGTGDAWRAVRLDYAGGRTAMTILLPDPGRQADVEALMAAGTWPALLDVPDGARVDVSLPRFTFRTGSAR